MKAQIWRYGFILALAVSAGGCIDDAPIAADPPPSAPPPVQDPEVLPTASTTAELFAKRYVAAGDRAYVIGTADGMFPPMGWHIRGEMGGVWAHPIKLLDGYWFAIDGEWLPPATRYTAGLGYSELLYPSTEAITVTRTELAPDGLPAVLVELTLQNDADEAREVTLTMDVRSELMASYPWGWTTPNAAEVNGKDQGIYDEATGKLVFTESDTTWTALVAASPAPANGAAGDGHWGPVPAAAQPDYLEYGNGTGGQLSWQVSVPAAGQEVIWVAIAGSHTAAEAAEAAATAALADPAQQLQRKIALREELLAWTQVSLPDASVQAAFDWSKLNMEDLRITATEVQVRDVDEGKDYPAAVATLSEITGVGAGFPDYPWLFGTDGAYTSLPLVASGQWDTAMAHLRAIRDVSLAINGNTGKVIHEVMTDGSVYFGSNQSPGNTNETAQFAIAVDLLWRWTGDDAFRDEMLAFTTQGLQYVTSELDADGDGWPEGYGMVERPGMGAEKLDVTAYTWQALHALARMAASAEDTATATWAKDTAAAMETAFEATWWMASTERFADSLCNADDAVSLADREANGWTNVCTGDEEQLQQRHWINVVPMEVGLATPETAAAALARLEENSGPCGLYHTGILGGPAEEGELKCWTLPNSAMAVAEASYGRLRDSQALFYIRSIADLLYLETPGALPEIAASPSYDAFVDFRERAMFMQAWSAYGVQWPIIRYFFGVDPDVPAQRLTVVPDLPESWPAIAVENLRVGDGVLEVAASHEQGGIYRTEVRLASVLDLVIGHTLPAGAEVVSVTLDGEAVEPTVVDTLRGREVRVETTSGVPRELVVIAE